MRYWIRFGAATGLAAIALQSAVEFSLQMPGNAALFVVLCAIALHERAACGGHGTPGHACPLSGRSAHTPLPS